MTRRHSVQYVTHDPVPAIVAISSRTTPVAARLATAVMAVTSPA